MSAISDIFFPLPTFLGKKNTPSIMLVHFQNREVRFLPTKTSRFLAAFKKISSIFGRKMRAGKCVGSPYFEQKSRITCCEIIFIDIKNQSYTTLYQFWCDFCHLLNKKIR